MVQVSNITDTFIRMLVDQWSHQVMMFTINCWNPISMILFIACQVHLALPQVLIITHQLTQGFSHTTHTMEHLPILIISALKTKYFTDQTLTFLRALFQQWIQLPVQLAKTALLAQPANQIVSVSSVAAVHTYLTLQLFILWAKEQPSNHWSATKPIQMGNPNNTVCNKSRFPNGRQTKLAPTTQFSTSYMLPEDTVFQEFLESHHLQHTIKPQIMESMLMERISHRKFPTLVDHGSATNLHPFLKLCQLLFWLLFLSLI